MISIAMVVLLLIGVNQVFQYTTQAVSVGQTMSSAIRDSRAAQTAFSQDLTNAAGANDGPFLIIHSAQVYAFRNRADMAADKDQDASTVDLTGSGMEGAQNNPNVPADTISPATYNYRNHRVDMLSFFSRGTFPAQTGDTQFVYPNITSNEARIWYGFLKLPNNTYANPTDTGSYVDSSGPTETYRFPGLASGTTSVAASAAKGGSDGNTPANDPNNFFATDWVLGRVATLLIPTLVTAPGPTQPQVSHFYSYQNGGTMWSANLGTPAAMSPLSVESTSADSTGSLKWKQEWSRFDVAQTSIPSYYSQLASYISGNANNNVSSGGWPDSFFYVGSFGGANSQLFQCNPFVTTFSTTSGNPTETGPEKMARTTPFFIKGCTQFIVEFAGDFVKQDDNPQDYYGEIVNGQTVYSNYGDVIDYVTASNGNADGLDYVLVPTYTSAGALNPRSLWTKKIRWYGLPRNTSGGTAVNGNQSASYTPRTATFVQNAQTDAISNKQYAYLNTSSNMPDVVPLRDVVTFMPSARLAGSNQTPPSLQSYLQGYLATYGNCWPERLLPGSGNPGSGTGAANYTAAGSTGMTKGSDYLVAWGPDTDLAGIPRPQLIRITITLDDSSSPNVDGQTYQYVFALPQQ